MVYLNALSGIAFFYMTFLITGTNSKGLLTANYAELVKAMWYEEATTDKVKVNK